MSPSCLQQMRVTSDTGTQSWIDVAVIMRANRLNPEGMFSGLTRMHSYRPSYIEGRLRLAENRERQRGKPAAGAATDGPPTAEERAAAEKAAEANMARLLQEEDAAKVSGCCSVLFIGFSSSVL